MKLFREIREKGFPRWLAYLSAFGGLLFAGLTLVLGYVVHFELGDPPPPWWALVVTGAVGAILPVAAAYVGWGLRELAKSNKWLTYLIVGLINVAAWCGLMSVTVAPFISSDPLRIFVYAGGAVMWLLIVAINHKVAREYRADDGGWD